MVLLFATTRSFVQSVTVPVVEVANTQIDPTGFRHRSSGDKSVGCALQANRCLTSRGEAPQSVQMSLGSPNTLCLYYCSRWQCPDRSCDRVHRLGGRCVLRMLVMGEWLICTFMTLYTEAYIVISGLSNSWFASRVSIEYIVVCR